MGNKGKPDSSEHVIPTVETVSGWGDNPGYVVQQRTAYVPVPELRPFFEIKEPSRKDEKGSLVFKVRGLNGEELYFRERFYNDEHKMILEGIQEGLIQSNQFKLSEAIVKVVGTKASGENELNPAELEAKKYVVASGVIEPRMDVARVCNIMYHHPLVFRRLADKILELTGLGSEVKKKP